MSEYILKKDFEEIPKNTKINVSKFIGTIFRDGLSFEITLPEEICYKKLVKQNSETELYALKKSIPMLLEENCGIVVKVGKTDLEKLIVANIKGETKFFRYENENVQEGSIVEKINSLKL